MKLYNTEIVHMGLLSLHIWLFLFINNADGQACSWPVDIVGTWTDSLKGPVTFQGDTTMTGWEVQFESDQPGDPNQVLTEWECVNANKYTPDGYVVMKATQTIMSSGMVLYVYRCIQMAKITDQSYRYYQINPVQPSEANDRLHITVDGNLTSIADLCDHSFGASGSEYQVMISTGNEAAAKVRCPYDFIGLYDYTHTTALSTTTCDASADTWNMCTDQTQMSFDYISCPTKVAYSAADTVWCVDNVPAADGTNYAMLYNHLDLTTDKSITFRFSCMAVSADNTQASISPQHCQANQDPASFPIGSTGSTLGAKVTLTQTSTTCPPCPVLSSPTQGSVIVSTEGATTIANYSCDPGNSLYGASIRTCLVTGTWDPADDPSCTCPAPNSTTNGTVTMVATVNVTTVTYTCDAGYVLVGNAERTCITDSNSWTGSDPTCELCILLAAPAAGTMTIASIGVTSQASFACNERYSMAGLPERFCLTTTSWNSTQPTCEFCQLLTTLFSGTIAYSTSGTVTTATCTCAPLYTLVGSTTLNCLSTGAWDNPQPVCVCDYPAVPADGGVVVTNANMTATYTCDLNFTMDAARTRECQMDGTGWDGTDPNCVGCSVKSLPAHGSVVVSTDGSVTSATYRCDLSYSMDGQQVSRCESTGSWQYVDAVCNECPVLSVPTGGSIDPSTNGVTTSAVYRCDTGRTLNGESEPYCHGSGSWSVDTAAITCALCVQWPDLDQGAGVMTTNGTQTTATFTCKSGYHLTGGKTAVCDGGGQWDVLDQTCDIDSDTSEFPWVPIVIAIACVFGVLIVVAVISLFFNFKLYKKVNLKTPGKEKSQKGPLGKQTRNIVTSPPMNQRLTTGKFRIQPSPTFIKRQTPVD